MKGQHEKSFNFESFDPEKPVMIVDQRFTKPEETKSSRLSTLFPPNPSALGFTEGMLFFSAIFENRESDVREMLTKNLRLVFIAIQSDQLRGLDKQNQSPSLTGLQYADKLHHSSICNVIINVMSSEEIAVAQIGRARVDELKVQNAQENNQSKPQLSPSGT